MITFAVVFIDVNGILRDGKNDKIQYQEACPKLRGLIRHVIFPKVI